LNLDIRICLEFSALSLGFDLGIASSLPLLAMTKEGACLAMTAFSVIARPFATAQGDKGASLRVHFTCHCERSVAIRGKAKLKNQKAK